MKPLAYSPVTISVVLAITAPLVKGFHHSSVRHPHYESLFSPSNQVLPRISSITTVGLKRRRNTIPLFLVDRETEISVREINGSSSQMETNGETQDDKMLKVEEETNEAATPDATRDPNEVELEDARKSISAAPSFEEYMKTRESGMASTTTATPSTTPEEGFQLATFLKDTIFLGVEPSPDVIAIASIYFVEGALGLARLAQTFLLKDELHLGPAELSALTGFFALPWTIKPLYGFLSDGVPLFGFRRRSYLILCGLVGAFSYTLVGNSFFGLLPTDGGADASSLLIPSTVACLIVSSACIAFSDVVADGIVVEKSRESNDPKLAGGLQSICWGSAAIGGLLSAYFSGSLLEVMKPQDVFRITAVLPFIVASIAFLINEKPVGSNGMIEEENKLANGTTNEETAGALAVQSSSSDVSIRSQIYLRIHE